MIGLLDPGTQAFCRSLHCNVQTVNCAISSFDFIPAGCAILKVYYNTVKVYMFSQNETMFVATTAAQQLDLYSPGPVPAGLAI